PRLGRSTNCWRSSTCPCEALEVSISGTSSVTCTLSLTEPISILRSSETVSWVATITCLRSNFLKPGASATTVYVAGTTWLKLKPSAAEMVARCPPPASSTSVTLVSPIDLPEPSSTVPRSPPRYDWLHDATANSAAQKIVFAVIYTSPLKFLNQPVTTWSIYL